MSILELKHPEPRVLVPGVLGALLCGAGIAVQARINGQLGAELGDGYVASVISFGTGMILMLLILAISKPGRRGIRIIHDDLRAGRMPWWMVMGGASGALFVLSQGLSAGLLGIAVFTVAVVFGQTLSGLAVDRRGIGSTPPRAITTARIAGSAMMLVAVVLVVSTQFLGTVPLWLVVLPFLAGLAIPWQQAANGEVRVISGSPVTATVLNFVVGLTLLVGVTAVHSMYAGLPALYPTNPVLYLGGVIGAGFIGLGAILAPRIGVLLLALGTISGQLIVALLLDIVTPAAGHPLAWTTVVGTAITLVALAVAMVPSHVLRGPKGTRKP
ncbi:DMT family transporter [Salinibacterium sp. G-O1]|uniref:DMT family transporter n=1 Tax=Salinibacterium sp. G-O1 TaxID=3046208 RepID=UPI0024B90BF3|nr:DMT family transporter [Salinibacterium sp. G-O1]MDJ0336059.1 DMT family transporter [Salinibacterium sp. G-O1]